MNCNTIHENAAIPPNMPRHKGFQRTLLMGNGAVIKVRGVDLCLNTCLHAGDTTLQQRRYGGNVASEDANKERPIHKEGVVPWCSFVKRPYRFETENCLRMRRSRAGQSAMKHRLLAHSRG